jgi:hypothetical protein
MWYRDKRRVERERAELERVAQAQELQAQELQAQEEFERFQQQALRSAQVRADQERALQVLADKRQEEADEALRKQKESVRKSLADRKSAVLESQRKVASQLQRATQKCELLDAELALRSSELQAIEVFREEDGMLVAIPENEVDMPSDLRALIQARDQARKNAVEIYQQAKATEENAAKTLREIERALEDSDTLEAQKHTSLSKHRIKTSSNPLLVSEPGAASRLTSVQLNTMKQLFGIESGASDAESSAFIESRETAIWTAYCNDIASFMPQAKQATIKKSMHETREYRDHSRGGWYNIKMWQDAQRALDSRRRFVESNLAAATLGVLGQGISNLTGIPHVFYYLRTVSPIDGTSQHKGKIVFFDADGVEIEGALLESVEKFDFLGRIANTSRGQKLTELWTFLSRPQAPAIAPLGDGATGSRAGVGAGAPSGPVATGTTGAASGRVG